MKKRLSIVLPFLWLCFGILTTVGIAQYDSKTGRLPQWSGATATIKYANDTVTGTEQYTLTTLLAIDPAKAQKVAAGSQASVGICISGCGTSGEATIVTGGIVQCQFDGAVTSANWVGISSSVAGKCTDLGPTRPATGRLIGRLLETNAIAGTYDLMLLGVGTMGALQGTLPSDASKYYDGTGVFSTPLSGGAPSFDAVTSGTNITAAMVVGTGASLGATGSGVIDATKIQSVAVTGTPVLGQIPIASSATAAAWADPLVSGFTAHDAAGGTTNPVAVGGFASAAAPADVDADTDIVRLWSLRNGSPVVNLATGGTLYDARSIRALSSGTDSVAVTGTFWQATQPVSGTFWQATQPVSGTFWQATQPVSGTVTAEQATGTNLHAVIDSGSTTAATQATAANLNVRQDTSGATGAAPPARADFIGGLASGATGGFLTGIPVCDSFFSVNIATTTTTLAITGVSGRHVYICGISLVTAAANNVALISGTGATCGTSTAGITGGTTAASGYNFADNGGITQGSGLGAINRTETAGDSVCIVTSAATQLSGAISYAIY